MTTVTPSGLGSACPLVLKNRYYALLTRPIKVLQAAPQIQEILNCADNLLSKETFTLPLPTT